jgi:hypothetical protein
MWTQLEVEDATRSAPLKRALLAVHVMCAAFLLIAIQPALCLALLPHVGGHPMLWHAMQIAFQALLLAGYVLAARARLSVVAGLNAVGALFTGLSASAPLPLSEPVSGRDLLWVLGQSCTVSFLALSTTTLAATRTAPALVNWQHSGSIYAVSSVGSLLAVCLYTAVIQPRVPLDVQLFAWKVTVSVLLALNAGWVLLAIRAGATRRDRRVPDDRSGSTGSTGAISVTGVLVSGAVPVALMLSCTSLLAEGLGSHPIVWMGPFGCYLLAAAVAFSGRLDRHVTLTERATVGASLLLVAGLCGMLPPMPSRLWVAVNLSAITLLIASWNLRVRRALREDEGNLATYLAWFSAGGTLGAVASFVFVLLFNPAVAGPPNPMLGYRFIFDWSVPEYVWLVTASVAALFPANAGDTRAGLIRGVILGGYLVVGIVLVGAELPAPRGVKFLVVLTGVLLSANWLTRRWSAASAVLVFVVAKAGILPPKRPLPVHHERTLLGQLRVEDTRDARWLRNGDTRHGSQNRACTDGSSPERCNETSGYYDEDAPIGIVLSQRNAQSQPMSVAVVGLGAGSLAGFGRKGDRFDFFEIDSAVIGIADRWFRYLAWARSEGVRSEVVNADGRLALRAAAPGSYDLVVIDAFSSDFVPTHLLTREAISEYLRATRDDGVVAVHTSSRHFSLEDVVLTNARANSAFGVAVLDSGADEGRLPSTWVFATKNAERAKVIEAALAADPAVAQIPPKRDLPWEDARIDIFAVLR